MRHIQVGAIAALLLLLGPVIGQRWVGPQCASLAQPAGIFQRPIKIEPMKWWPVEDKPHLRYLYRGNTFLGEWNAKKGIYRRQCPDGQLRTHPVPLKPPKVHYQIAKDTQKKVCDCVPGLPCTCEKDGLPCPCDEDVCECCLLAKEKKKQLAEELIEEKTGKKSWQVSGVDRDKIGKSLRCTVGGKEVPCYQALKAVKDDLPNDNHKPFLVIKGGTDDQRKQVLADIDTNPALVMVKTGARVQSYRDDDPLIKRQPYSIGTPEIVLQAEDGEVLWHQEDYKGGALALAEAIRKQWPYDPSKAPNPNMPPPVQPGPVGGNVPWSYWAVGGALLYLLFKK